MAREYPEMVEDCIEMIKNLQDKIVPHYCFLGFIYGTLNKKKRVEFDRLFGDSNPVKEYIFQELNKQLISICKKCNTKLKAEDKFCSNCGEKKFS